MPAHDQGVSSFNCAIGADQVGPTVATGDTVMNYLGANLTAAGATATLTIYDGTVAQNVVIATLSAPTLQNSVDVVPTFIAIKNGTIHYTLAGAGSTAQIRWNTG